MRRILKTLTLLFIIASQGIAQEDNQIKKYVIGGAFNLSATTTSSQYDNLVFVSPTVTLNSIERRENTTTIFTFNPYLAKQMGKSSMLGLGLGYTYNRDKFEFLVNEVSNSNNVTTSHLVGIELFYRKYLFPSKTLNLFVQPFGRFQTSFGNLQQNAPAFEETKSNLFTAGVDLNIAYNFHENWTLLARVIGANYQYSKSRRASLSEANTSNSFFVSSAISNFRFGIERRF